MKHFAIDIDGCITNGKGKFTDKEAFLALQNFIEEKKLSVFLCTGRSAPYVEAISQLLHINQWCICENGAYLYQPMTDEVLYHPLVTRKTLKALSDFNTLLQEYSHIYKAEIGKSICISLNPIDITIEELFNILKEKIDTELLYINHSTTAVDITPKGVDKGSALEFLCQKQNYSLEDIVAIGDTSGDLPFMKISGTKACPANASGEVREIASYVSSFESTGGVLDILKEYFVTLTPLSI